MDKPETLTPKQAAFAGFVAKGLSYSDAYRKAYQSKASQNAINVEASRMMKKLATTLSCVPAVHR